MRRILFYLLSLVFPTYLFSQKQLHVVNNLKVTILSSMVAQEGIGEWGFSALIEVDNNKILFDAGSRKTTVLENAKELNIDLSKVPTLVLSHWHDDHTTGWLPLRNAMKIIQQNAFSTTHVGKAFFDMRINAKKDTLSRKQDSSVYISTGGVIIEHTSFKEIFPGVYLTGNVPRVHTEKNYYTGTGLLNQNNAITEDNIPDDMSLIISTNQGLVLISGCGHSGIVNNIEHINKNLPSKSIIAAIGGFHLLTSSDDQIKWTAERIKNAGVKYFMGAHCTGIEAVYQIRSLASLKRGECIVGSVGDTFDLQNGFINGDLTR